MWPACLHVETKSFDISEQVVRKERVNAVNSGNKVQIIVFFFVICFFTQLVVEKKSDLCRRRNIEIYSRNFTLIFFFLGIKGNEIFEITTSKLV